MYCELITALRTCVDEEKSCSECPYYGKCMNTVGKHAAMIDAADAIEELSMRLHGDEAAIAGMKREIECMVRAEKPRWIPVTERLPDVTLSGRDVDGFAENPDGTISVSSYFDIYESKDCLVYGLVEGVMCLSVAKWTIWDFNDGERKDADALEKKAPELSEYLSVLAPTIIPASEEGET